MPRLNHGTLLENLVVLEVTRVLATRPDTTCEFAAAFAMPPLTQWWQKGQYEHNSNTRLNAEVITKLRSGVLAIGPEASYSALLRACLTNTPDLPVVPYALTDAYHGLSIGGPNGALLAAMLRRHHGQAFRLWSNDISGLSARYREAARDASTECPLTSQHAHALINGGGDESFVEAFCDHTFPNSVEAFAAWRKECAVRIGFLDPDMYVGDNDAQEGHVNSAGHIEWLTNLHVGASDTAAVMYFNHRTASYRRDLIEAFHMDAVADFPRSVVFVHGNHMVGVKLRGPKAEDSHTRVVRNVASAWAAWATIVGMDPDGLARSLDGGALASH
jgi:hypothetical protein